MPSPVRLLGLLGLLVALTLNALGATAGSATARAAPEVHALPPPATHSVSARGTPLLVGAHVDGMQADPSVFTAFEQMVGRPMQIASYYYGFGDVFPGQTELTFAAGGSRDVLLSWDMGPTRFRQWARGRYDRYLDTIARAAKGYPYTVYVRPWPEMNGDWQSFQPTADGSRPYGGTYRQFVQAWRHVVTRLRQQGVTNVRWVFNPTADTYAETTPVARIWPGRRYVDVLGLDGYNWGQDAGWGRWQSFDDIFAAQYRTLTRLDPFAPVWICEFGSKEPLTNDGAPIDPQHSKATWLVDALGPHPMPHLQALVYFQADKERDWRVNSSAGALSAFRSALASIG